MDVVMDETELPEVRSSVALCGFLELVIHQLLYVKNIYPKCAFTKIVRKDVFTYMCRHPGVRKYILDFLDFANGFLMQEKRFKVIFVLKRRSGEILEQFVFEMKVNELDLGSPDKLIKIVDNLIPICKDIEKNNSIHYENTLDSGDQEITFELQVRIYPPSVIPRIKPGYPWVAYLCPEPENLMDRFQPLKRESNNTYEMNAFSYHNETKKMEQE